MLAAHPKRRPTSAAHTAAPCGAPGADKKSMCWHAAATNPMLLTLLFFFVQWEMVKNKEQTPEHTHVLVDLGFVVSRCALVLAHHSGCRQRGRDSGGQGLLRHMAL